MRASSLLNLSERYSDILALDFDFACSYRLRIEDSEREQRLLEAASGGLLAKALTGATATTDSTRYAGEITPANFRDQGF